MDIKSKILVQAQRISKNLVDLEVALTLESLTWGRMYSIAQEIIGHAGEIMSICKARAAAEAKTSLETWKEAQKNTLSKTLETSEKTAP